MEVDFIRGDSKSCLARSGRRREHRAGSRSLQKSEQEIVRRDKSGQAQAPLITKCRMGSSQAAAGHASGGRMIDIGSSRSGLRSSPPSIVEISPSDIARRRLANWGAIQADMVRVIRRETFE